MAAQVREITVPPAARNAAGHARNERRLPETDGRPGGPGDTSAGPWGEVPSSPGKRGGDKIQKGSTVGPGARGLRHAPSHFSEPLRTPSVSIAGHNVLKFSFISLYVSRADIQIRIFNYHSSLITVIIAVSSFVHGPSIGS